MSEYTTQSRGFVCTTLDRNSKIPYSPAAVYHVQCDNWHPRDIETARIIKADDEQIGLVEPPVNTAVRLGFLPCTTSIVSCFNTTVST